ncbi:MAG: hypothetical protein RJQ14_16480, partial [Marinoscillum sp.]
FKRYQWLSKFYFPIYRFVSMITLARFYRPIYYTLVSNFTRWKIGVFLVCFIAVSILSLDKIEQSSIPGESMSGIELWSNSRGVASFSGYYDDQNDQFHSVQAHIQSDIISENTIRLFVVMKVGMEDSIRKHCEYDSLIKLDTALRYIQKHCVSEFYRVLLDGHELHEVAWSFYYKQKTDQRGIITYIDITELNRGTHEIEVKGPPNMYRGSFAQIPFYRELSQTGYHVPDKPKEEEADNYLELKGVLPK